MTTTNLKTSLVDFYEERVLPALFDRLDVAFPEFGWKQTSRGWVATNREHTKTLTGARLTMASDLKVYQL